MKDVYVKFRDLKAYHMYYWPRHDGMFFIEYKVLDYSGELDTHMTLDYNVYHEDLGWMVKSEFLELGEL